MRALQQPASALAAALEFQPDIVFLDLAMPEIDGYEVARRMRRQRRLEGAFLMAVTGYGLEEDRAKTQAAGFDGYLLKPIDLQQLKVFLQKRPHPAPRPRIRPVAQRDGFATMVERVAGIERQLGIYELAQFTPKV